VLDTVFGLPVHPLVVHATVVLVPLAAILVAVAAAWPRTRARLAWPTVVVSAVATLSVAIAALSGKPLVARVPASPLIGTHSALAKGLAVWVVAMTGAVFLLAYLSWRRAGAGWPGWLRVPESARRLATTRALDPVLAARWVMPAVVALSLLTAAGTMVQVVLVGHSGARAAWTKVVQTPPRHIEDR
jgi:hypothetical protein